MFKEIDFVNDRMMKMVEIVKLVELSDKWLYQLISEGLFPEPIKFGRSSRWFRSEVLEWFSKRNAKTVDSDFTTFA
ncbi:hypothetical protein ABR36_01520 [Enterobacter ludwigii]|nr:hypothetical protein ABR36_01520 [Enterobacter ludwigii]